MPFRLTASMFLGFMLACSAGAQGAALPTLRSALITEMIDPVVPISGEGVIGMVMLGAGDFVDPDNLYVYIVRAPERGRLSFHLSSADGRYIARWTADVAPGTSGWARVEYPGAARQRIAALAPEQLAVLASDGQSSFPVRWRQPAFADALVIMINAERADAFAVERNSERRRRVDCQPVQGSQSIRFDRICRLDRESAEIENGHLEIRRRHSGRHLASLIVRLAQ